MTEKEFQKKVKIYLDNMMYIHKEFFWFHCPSNFPTMETGYAWKQQGWKAGIPDCNLIMNGKYLGIELKVGSRQPNENQKLVFKRISSVFICRNLDEVKQKTEFFIKKNKKSA